ncbi:MAG: response regulator transcription factor [Candidatus Gastranaerophilaceae bacterium]|jgi:DNA-binding NarL/FixJ family response regulator|nr:DNA-binding response regulator [bacterium]CDE91332.1 two Component Transcriptional Regulator LuxR family protein [Fusobacterium sp. CAG:815]DAA92488.1 MAG TPA: DNA-binding response regulator [Candidatus Gastranaerophilales bacterium HUM_7]DAA92738.1 MAG TPA: DNA-binding response regulator [Candidatus Gastranaerophilales bacterium HUM_6]DAB02711.1 MAG TPA: DNA-binding response regulator [Candidatus Gastranaerophilales bacterium HUM_12]DAB06002.1 MAG TPA: DNA-binding response regulator [Candi
MSDLAKILLVDDNPKYLADVLPFYGYDLKCVSDGVQALSVLDSGEFFDIVLLDVMMPNMNGWDTLKTIRKNSKTKDIPVIMLTAVNEDQKMISGLKIGADDYIVKPFILPNLLARIEAVLRRANRNKQVLKPENVTINQADNFNSLTKREKDVLLLVTQGESNKSIADKLVLSEVTVKSHLNSIFKKLNVTNRTQAVLVAMQMNLVENNK